MGNLEADRKKAKGELIELSDGIVHYELSGPRDGPLVVLIHGFSTPYYGWDGIMHPLRRAGLRVLRYDLYGRGLSDRPWTRYDLDLYLRQLVQLLAVLSLEGPLFLAGWSMGSVIASNYALRHPDRAKRLALLAPAGLPVNLPLSARMVRAPVFGELLMLALGNRVLLRTQDKLFADKSHLPAFLDRFEIQLRYPGLRHALLSSLRNVPLETNSEVYAELGRRDLPIGVVWGDEDEICPYENHRQLLTLLPQAELHTLEGTGHGIAIERPMAVSKHLCDLFAGDAAAGFDSQAD